MPTMSVPVPDWVRAGLWKIKHDNECTQGEVARMLGFSQDSISRMMRGGPGGVTPKTLDSYLAALAFVGISPDTPMPPPPPRQLRPKYHRRRKVVREVGRTQKDDTKVPVRKVDDPGERQLVLQVREAEMNLEVLRFRARAAGVLKAARAGEVQLAHLKVMLRNYGPDGKE